MRVAVLGGTGDAYLVCALVGAFREHHRRDVEVVLHSKLEAVARMFDVRYAVDDVAVDQAQGNQAMQRSYDNLLLASPVYYAHPCFARSGVRIDQLTARPCASQADMYRVMLHLPPSAPLARPRLPAAVPARNSVLVIPESTSWPCTQPSFWSALVDALRSSGRRVTLNDRAWPLATLFERCAASEWVIGPQCGVMSILVAGGFPCRKTVATPSMDDNDLADQWADHTYPYGYVTKFDGQDYDVEEYKVTDDNHPEVIRSVVDGANARRLWPHDPSPVSSVTMPMTPGDFLDRLAVLTVKMESFDVERRAAVEREYLRFREARRRLDLTTAVIGLLDDLVALHRETFRALRGIVPAALSGESGDQARSARLNLERTRIRREIDRLMHAPYTEVKDYHD